MLTLFIILGLIAAASAATLYLRRTKLSSEMLGRQSLSGAENFRPLFEPSKAELLTEQSRSNGWAETVQFSLFYGKSIC